MRDAIVATKVRGARGAEPLVAAATERLRDAGLELTDVVLVPVPPHPTRLKSRLGHLPDRFAAALAATDVRANAQWPLTRHDTGPMRRDHGAIGPDLRANHLGHGRRAIVVDDVVTTGLTLAAAVAALAQEDWLVVGAVCLADARS